MGDAEFERLLRRMPQLVAPYKQLLDMGYSRCSCREAIVKNRNQTHCLERCVNDLTS